MLNGTNSSNGFSYTWTSIDTPPVQIETDYNSLIATAVTPDKSYNFFVLTAASESGKCVTTDTLIVKVELAVTPWNSFSPNGDNAYDSWIIENIENYPNALIEIYNRWGNLVWQSVGYDNSGKAWKGDNFRSGQLLPVATYYYVIYPNGDTVKDPLTGHVTIVK